MKPSLQTDGRLLNSAAVYLPLVGAGNGPDDAVAPGGAVTTPPPVLSVAFYQLGDTTAAPGALQAVPPRVGERRVVFV